MSHAPRVWWLETKSYAPRKPRHRLASLGNPKKKKCSLLFCFSRGWIFSKMERIFFFGVLPSKYSGSAAGRNADSAKRKSIFLGKRFFRFASANFPPAERGLGNECGRACARIKLMSYRCQRKSMLGFLHCTFTT